MSIFKETFPEYVTQQLKIREEILVLEKEVDVYFENK